MIPTGFHEFDVEVNDFPIQVSIATAQLAPPKIKSPISVTYVIRTNGNTVTASLPATLDKESGRMKFAIPLPNGFTSGVILFTLMVGIPLQQTTPYTVHFDSDDHQFAKDRIFPDVVTPVFANYSMELK